MPANGRGDCGHLFVRDFVVGDRGLEVPYRSRHQGHGADQDRQEHEHGTHTGDHEYRAQLEQTFFHDVPSLQSVSGQLYWMNPPDKSAFPLMPYPTHRDPARRAQFASLVLVLVAWLAPAGPRGHR